MIFYIVVYLAIGLAVGRWFVQKVAGETGDAGQSYEYFLDGFVALVTALLWPLFGAFYFIGLMARAGRRP